MGRSAVQNRSYPSVYEMNPFNYRKNYSKQLKEAKVNSDILNLINTNLEFISLINSKNIYIKRGVFCLNEEDPSHSTHQRITAESLKAFADFSYSYLKSHNLKKEEAALVVDNLEKAIEKLAWEAHSDFSNTREILDKTSKTVLANEDLDVLDINANDNDKTIGQSLIENKLKSLQTLNNEQIKLQKKIDQTNKILRTGIFMLMGGGLTGINSLFALIAFPFLAPILFGVGLFFVISGIVVASVSSNKLDSLKQALNEKKMKCEDPLGEMKKFSSYLAHYRDSQFQPYLNHFSLLLNKEEHFYKVHELFRLETMQASEKRMEKISKDKIQKLSSELEKLKKEKTTPFTNNNNEETFPRVVSINPQLDRQIETLNAELKDEEEFKGKIDNRITSYEDKITAIRQELDDSLSSLQKESV